MFIKKDLRKIPKILDDAIECEDDATMTTDNDKRDAKRAKRQEPLSELRLGRRQHEFQGSIQILCQPQYLPKLQNLASLNLYDCAIANLDGIGLLGHCPSLEILNLGRNPLTTLPDELSLLGSSLRELWLDDCQLTGELPQCVAELPQLQVLRVPQNKLSKIPASIVQLRNLRILCLDRNPLKDDTSGAESDRFPALDAMTNLRELFLRHTSLKQLPRLPTSLQVLHVSSNPISNLNVLIDSRCSQLTHMYANGCQLTDLPDAIVSSHPQLERMVLSHNPRLTRLPSEIWKAAEEKEGKIVWKPNDQIVPDSSSDDSMDHQPTTSNE